MYAISYRAYLFVARNSRINIQDPAIFLTIPYQLTSFPIKLSSTPIHTAMSVSQPSNNSFPEVMISSNNECVFSHDLNHHTLQIIFNAWWPSMNAGSKRSIAWKNSRHEPSWWLSLHCVIEETGSPGIRCRVCQYSSSPSISTCDPL